LNKGEGKKKKEEGKKKGGRTKKKCVSPPELSERTSRQRTTKKKRWRGKALSSFLTPIGVGIGKGGKKKGGKGERRDRIPPTVSNPPCAPLVVSPGGGEGRKKKKKKKKKEKENQKIAVCLSASYFVDAARPMQKGGERERKKKGVRKRRVGKNLPLPWRSTIAPGCGPGGREKEEKEKEGEEREEEVHWRTPGREALIPRGEKRGKKKEEKKEKKGEGVNEMVDVQRVLKPARRRKKERREKREKREIEQEEGWPARLRNLLASQLCSRRGKGKKKKKKRKGDPERSRPTNGCPCSPT